MANISSIDVPEEFGDFSAVNGDESHDLSLRREEEIRRTVALLQHGSRIRIIRDFIDAMPATQDEEMLQRLWMSTSPLLASQR